MPTYQYQCPKCGLFEKFQMMKDSPLSKCEKCNSKVVRLIGAGGGVIFKGPGFHCNDYRKEEKTEHKD